MNPPTPAPDRATVTYGSVCSGIEAPSAAWHPLGWKPMWFSEIETFPKKVLAHRYPGVPDLGDMTTLPARILAGEVPAPDVFVGGTPCQAFSVAGLRLGLADPRGQLTRTYVEILDALDTVRARQGKPPTVALWENVPGVLSDSDNAFGNFLGALCGEDDALLPAGPRWTNAGSVLGPRRALAWRVLDAQFFGVAQRRRRVFLVASARESRVDPVEVLLVEEGVRRDPPPRAQARQGLADALGNGSSLGGGGRDGRDGGRGRGVATSHWDGDYPHPSLTQAHNTGGIGQSNQELFSQRGNGLVPHYPCMAHGQANAEIREDGGAPTLTCLHEAPIAVQQRRAIFTGDGTLADPIGAHEARTYTNEGSNNFRLHNCVGEPSAMLNDGVVGTLTARNGRNGGVANDDVDARRFALTYASAGQFGAFNPVDVADTLRAKGGDVGMGSETLASCQPMTYAAQSPKGGVTESTGAVLAPAITASNDPSRSPQSSEVTQQVAAVYAATMAVRRLTPVECERLQGFPDGYTAIPWGKKPAEECPDGPRYKALGNSMAVPVIRWLGIRIGRSL